jgi:hypothetical protein
MAFNEAPALYRLHAADCVVIAQRNSDPNERATLLAMAKSWLTLADRADKEASRGLVQQQQQPQPKEE